MKSMHVFAIVLTILCGLGLYGLATCGQCKTNFQAFVRHNQEIANQGEYRYGYGFDWGRATLGYAVGGRTVGVYMGITGGNE